MRRQKQMKQQLAVIQMSQLIRRQKLHSIMMKHRRRKHRLRITAIQRIPVIQKITAIQVMHSHRLMQHIRHIWRHRQQQTQQPPRQMSRQYMTLQQRHRKHIRHM